MTLDMEHHELQGLQTGDKKAQIVSGMGRVENKKPLGLRGRAVFMQVSMSILANLSVLSAGMALGYPAVTLKQLTDPNEKVTLNESQASWFAAIHAIACPLGGLLSGYLLDKVGRKYTIFTINGTAIFAWGLMALAPDSDHTGMFVQIMISRFIIGITTGLASSPVGVYSAEVCHPKLRGRLCLGTSISTAAGILFIYTLGYFIRDNWRLISGIACVYSVVAAVLTIPVPESPSWLMMKGRIEEAEKSLRFFRGIKRNDIGKYQEIDTELQALMKSAPISDKKISIFDKVRRPEVYKPLLIMIGFFACQQFSGIFVVIVYAVQFSIEAGVTIDPILCAMLVGFTRMASTFLVGYILDKWGRRPPAMCSGLGMAICMGILAASTWFPVLHVKFLPVACIVIYIFASTFGLMTLPFSMISEVYPQNVRGAAAGITICCAYLMSFVTIKLYPSMVTGMGKENVFAFYGIASLLAVVYIYLFLPETKGKTLAEIEEYFKNGKSPKNEKYMEVKFKEIGV